MYEVRYGGKRGRCFKLEVRPRMLVLRTRSRADLDRTPLSRKARTILDAFEEVARFEHSGVQVLQAREKAGAAALRDKARGLLARESQIEFAGRVLSDAESGTFVVYTENLFVKFKGDLGARACREILRRHGLAAKRELEYSRNAWFVSAPRGTGLETFAVASALLQEEGVELCHPEIVRKLGRKKAFPSQWHLKKTVVDGQAIDAHSSVESAWKLSEGAGTILAIIDDGIDVDHEEFKSRGKVVFPRDMTLGTASPRPGTGDDHGTACAGVACADGRFGASGVAPRAQLMPVRLVSGLGSQNEADAFVWAARHGADVISCSWGPEDGKWWDSEDPLHRQKVPLPDATRLAIDWAVAHGRGGRGCIIVFAAGNGNESVDNDGYASYEKVMAVAACNDSGKRSAYSDRGRALWCAFPSSHGYPSKTPGIWTTDRTGRPGYNPGQARLGDAAGNYTNGFGGTSSSAPGVAGVAALVLALNPDLTWTEVRDLLRKSCDPIDKAGGKYDRKGHSKLYGYGRVNAGKAVALAASSRKKHGRGP